MDKNPCDECIIKMCCNKMCEPASLYYKSKVRIRSKEEVIKNTGYMWEFENGILVSLYKMDSERMKIYNDPYNKKGYMPNIRVKAFKKESVFQSIINLLKKGLKLCQQLKNKSTLKD